MPGAVTVSGTRGRETWPLPLPHPREVPRVVEEQVNRPMPVQQVSADPEVRKGIGAPGEDELREEALLAEPAGKEGSVQTRVVNGPV